jgi:hypothetical protein
MAGIAKFRPSFSYFLVGRSCPLVRQSRLCPFVPFCAHDAEGGFPPSGWKRMVGTRRLELLTSTVSR